MDNLTYVPIIVGGSLFVASLYILSKKKKQNKAEILTATSNKSSLSPKEVIKSPLQKAPQVNYGPVNIYFGSQTGASHNFAKALAEEAKKAGFEPTIIDLADFHPESFKDVKFALFTVSTQGEGEPPENAKKFYQYLISSERTATDMKGLKYSVFGLGNKQYQYYNAMGKRFNQEIERCGGERVYRYGEGDDNENLEDDFNSWKEGVWAELTKVAQASGAANTTGSRKSSKQSSKAASAQPYVVKFSSDLKEIDLDIYDAKNDGKEYDFQIKQYLSSSSANFTLLKELRQKTDDGSTLHVEIDCASAGLTYQTAQNLSIYPENSSDDVEKVAKLLGLNLGDVFTIEKNPEDEKSGSFKHPIPSPISVETYLTKFCDIQGSLKKKQLKDLAQFCQNEDKKNKLLFLASSEGKAEYDIQIQSRMRGLLDLIEEYGIQLSLENLLQISSLIQPRLYTIASSSKQHPNSVHLCVTVSDDTLPDGTNKRGLTSSYLVRRYQESLQGKALGKAKINIRDSTFSLPTDSSKPVIMVGPGAGIAPFKGFVDEKAYLMETGGENTYGELTLYFGCKGNKWDNLYKEELAQHQANGILKDYYVAFSREQEKKVYVQDLIQKNGEQMSQLLFEQNGTLYICGSMAMGKSVLAKVAELAASHYKIDLKEAHSKVEELEKNKKVIKELWG
jgi:NADPH-ferrihemoprotein reductase